MSAGLGDLGSLRVRINLATKEFSTGVGEVDTKLQGLANRTNAAMTRIGGAMAGFGVATVAGVGIAVNEFANFERGMKNVQAVSQASQQEYETLSEFALKMGRDTAFSAKEAAEGFYYLASAGYDTQKQMAATEGILALAAATQSDLATSSQTVVTTLSAFEKQAGQAGHIADVFAKAIGSSQANLGRISVSLPYTAATFHDLGYSVESNVAALSLLYDKGLRAESAAVQLRTAIKTLLDPTDEQTAALKSMGLTIDDVNPATHSLVEIVGAFETAGLNAASAAQLFGKRGDAMTLLAKTGAVRLEEFTRQLEGSGGAAQAMADIQLEGLSGALTILKSSIEGVVIAFGQQLAPEATKAARLLTDLLNAFNALPDPIKKVVGVGTIVGGGLTAIAGAGVLIAGQLPGAIAAIKLATPAIGGLAIAAAPVAATLAAIASSGWAVKRMMDALKDSTTDLTGQMDGQLIAYEGQRKAIGMVTAAMERAKQAGIDPTNMSIESLGINVDKLNEAYNESGTIFDKATDALTGTGNATTVLIPPTTKAGALMAILQKRVGETREKFTGLNEELDRTPEKMDETADKAGKVGTATSTAAKQVEAAMLAMKKAVAGAGDGWAEQTTAIEREQAAQVAVIKEHTEWVYDWYTNDLGLLVLGMVQKTADEKVKITKTGLKEEMDARSDTHMGEISDLTETRQKEINIEINTGTVVQKIRDDGSLHKQELTDRELEMGEKRGAALLAEKQVEEEALARSVISWGEFGNAAYKATTAVSDAYYGIVDAWRTITGDQRAFHDTWISDMADWADRIKNILDSVITIWKNASTVIAKIAQFIGGDGDGGAIGDVGNIAGLVKGGDGGGLLETAGGVSGGASVLGKIGGGIKSGASAVGSGAEALASAVAPALPLLGPLAAAAGTMYLIQKFHKPPGAMSEEAEKLWQKGIEYQELLAFKENRRYEKALARETQIATIQAATAKYIPGFGDTRNSELVAYAAATGADLSPTRINIPGATRQDFVNAARAGVAIQEYMNQKMDTSNTHLEKIAINTDRMIELEEIRDRRSAEQIDRQAILNQLVELLAPLFAEKGYI